MILTFYIHLAKIYFRLNTVKFILECSLRWKINYPSLAIILTSFIK